MQVYLSLVLNGILYLKQSHTSEFYSLSKDIENTENIFLSVFWISVTKTEQSFFESNYAKAIHDLIDYSLNYFFTKQSRCYLNSEARTQVYFYFKVIDRTHVCIDRFEDTRHYFDWGFEF